MEARKIRIERPKSLTETAIDALRNAIIRGQIPPGEQLSESTLATELGLSKTPVREALLKLQGEGLVVVSPRRGTFVFSLAPGELTQICELRLALESGALHLAAERNRGQLVRNWSAVVDRMRQKIARNDTSGYLMEDSAFHAALIDAADNTYFSDAYGLVAAKVTTLRLKLGRDHFHMNKSMLEHEQLLDHVNKGNVAEAQDVLRRHIARKEGSYWEHLDPQPPRYLTEENAFPDVSGA
jgi:DNA-binding GntR family transcriptional regulator